MNPSKTKMTVLGPGVVGEEGRKELKIKGRMEKGCICISSISISSNRISSSSFIAVVAAIEGRIEKEKDLKRMRNMDTRDKKDILHATKRFCV